MAIATASFNERIARINKKGPGTYITPGPAADRVRNGAAATSRSAKIRINLIATMMGGLFGVGAGMYYALIMSGVLPWTVDFKGFEGLPQAEQLAIGLVGLSLPLLCIGFLLRRIRPGALDFAMAYAVAMVAAYHI
ncbi:MAG: hypothetical protein ABJI96_14985 [Paracoccaceae bacterium]